MNLPAEESETLQSATDKIIRTAMSASDDAASNHSSNLPVVVIEPRTSRRIINLRELWKSHELLYFLTWRDIKVRYKQTLLGVLWAILQPLSMMFVFTVFFGKMIGVPSDALPYPLFAFAGLLPWTFFTTALNTSSNSIVSNANLVTKVYFPRLLVPIAAVLAALIDFAISLVVLAVLMIYYRTGLNFSLFMLPVLMLVLLSLAIGCGVLTSALNVKYRDIRFVVPFLIQVWFFASPIIYSTSIVPERWRWILSVNPMTGILEGFRVALFGHKPFNWTAMVISIGISLVLLLYALVTFNRMEKSFADIV